MNIYCLFNPLFFCVLLSLANSGVAAKERPKEKGVSDHVEAHKWEKTLALSKGLETYHRLLLRRPEALNLFNKFKEKWALESQQRGLDAEKSLTNFLRKNAENAKKSEKFEVAHLQLYSTLLRQQGDFAAAKNWIDAAILRVETSAQMEIVGAQLYFDKALISEKSFDFDSAIQAIQNALKLEQKGRNNVAFLLEANKMLGRYYCRQDLADKAVKHWSKLAKDNPDNQDLIEDVIDVLLSQGLFAPALKFAKGQLTATKDPYKRAQRMIKLSEIHLKMGNKASAIAIYEQAISLSGAGSWFERECITKLEEVYREEGKISELNKKLAELVDQFPNRLELALREANALSDSEKYSESVDKYSNLLKRNPNNQKIRKNLLSVLDKSGDHKAARLVAMKLIEIDPEDVEMHLTMAKIYKKLNDHESSLEYLESFNKMLNPEDQISDGKVPFSEHNLLRYPLELEALGFSKKALIEYGKLVKTYPQNTEIQFVVIEYMFEKKLVDKALKIIEKLAISNDSNVIVRLIKLLKNRKQWEFAHSILLAKKSMKNMHLDFFIDGSFIADKSNRGLLALDLCEQSFKRSKSSLEIQNSLHTYLYLLNKYDASEDLFHKLKKRFEQKEELSAKEQLCLIYLSKRLDHSLNLEMLFDQIAKCDNVGILKLLAEQYHQNKAYHREKLLLRRILAMNGGKTDEVYRLLVECLQKQGYGEEALAEVRSWKSVLPNSREARLVELSILSKMKSRAEVSEYMQKLTYRFGDDLGFQQKLAKLFAELGETQKAQVLYWKIFNQNLDRETRSSIIKRMVDLGRKDGSIRELIEKFNKRCESAPQVFSNIISLAKLYEYLGSKEKNLEALQKGLKLKPNDPDLVLKIVDQQKAIGKRKDAILTLELYLENQQSEVHQILLAGLYFEFDRREEALALIRQLSRRSDVSLASEKLVFESAQRYLKNGEKVKAMVTLEVFLKNKESEKLGELLGKLYVEVGEAKEAIATYSKFLKPEDSSILVEQIVRNLIRDAEYEEADEALKVVFNFWKDDVRFQILSSINLYEMGYPRESFDQALSILKSKSPKFTASKGWKLATLKPIAKITGFDFSILKKPLKELVLFRIVDAKRREIAALNEVYHFNYQMNFVISGGGVNVLPADRDGAILMAKSQIIHILKDYRGEAREKMKQQAELAGFKRLELFNQLSMHFEKASESARTVQGPTSVKLLEGLPRDYSDPLVVGLELLKAMNNSNPVLEEEVYQLAHEMKGEFAAEIQDFIGITIAAELESSIQNTFDSMVLSEVDRMRAVKKLVGSIETKSVTSDLNVACLGHMLSYDKKCDFQNNNIKNTELLNEWSDLENRSAKIVMKYLKAQEQLKKKSSDMNKLHIIPQVLGDGEVLRNDLKEWLIHYMLGNKNSENIYSYIEEDIYWPSDWLENTNRSLYFHMQVDGDFIPLGMESISLSQYAFFIERFRASRYQGLSEGKDKIMKHLNNFKNPILKAFVLYHSKLGLKKKLTRIEEMSFIKFVEDAKQQENYVVDAYLLDAFYYIYSNQSKLFKSYLAEEGYPSKKKAIKLRDKNVVGNFSVLLLNDMLKSAQAHSKCHVQKGFIGHVFAELKKNSFVLRKIPNLGIQNVSRKKVPLTPYRYYTEARFEAKFATTNRIIKNYIRAKYRFGHRDVSSRRLTRPIRRVKIKSRIARNGWAEDVWGAYIEAGDFYLNQLYGLQLADIPYASGFNLLSRKPDMAWSEQYLRDLENLSKLDYGN